MELKTLFIGIVFTMGIFAVKSGVGIHYLLTRKTGRKSRFAFLSFFGLIYLFLFFSCAYTIQRIDVIAYFETVQRFLKYGMALHVLMAGGVLVWGVLMLKAGGKSVKGKHAWLIMVFPCPVCMTVIFLSLSFLISYFPNAVHMMAISTYLAFMGIALATVTTMALWQNIARSAPELTMGTAMVLISIYFLLSIIVLPQFGNVSRIYRLAAYQGETQMMGPRELLLLISLSTAFFIGGFIRMTKKLKARSEWT
mgnify:CR=1 FL=1